jgi:alpha-tubulin suppressor-like RCC1 family protein
MHLLFRTRAASAALLLLAALASCKDVTSPEDIAVSMTLISGANQAGRVSSPLAQPIVVRVSDRRGAGVKNADILFSPATGSGATDPMIARTDSTGHATVTWFLGTALGPMTMTISFADLTPVTVTATAVPDRLEIASGDGQVSRLGTALPLPVVIQVRDIIDAPVPGALVTFTADAGSGSVSPATVAADNNGLARTFWTLGTTPGEMRLTVTSPTAPDVLISATATVDTSRVITRISGNAQVGTIGTALADPLVVRVTDRFGNNVAGVTIEWNQALSPGITVQPTSSTTDADGLASTTVRLSDLAGAATVRAAVRDRSERVNFSLTSSVEFTSVFAGNYFTCGLSAGGAAYCWGFNEDGQLGQGALADGATRSNAPSVSVFDAGRSLAPTFRKMSANTNHACAVTIARTLMCWGTGNGTLGASEPSVIGSLASSSIADVATGMYHTCALDVAGFVRCGGENQLGQLGDSTVIQRSSPVDVKSSLRYSAVSAGRLHTCAFPRNTTTPQCWGDNADGQVGDGTAITRRVPTSVVSGVTFDTLSLVSGALHSCALSAAGAAHCWGSDAYGQLGRGSVGGSAGTPTAVSGGLTFVKLFAGEYHTCGLTAAGEAHCWGRNISGQLGTGSAGAPVSTPTAVTGGLSFRALSLGELHSCGILAGADGVRGTTATPGTVYCWGDSEYGQAGTGSYRANASPLLAPTRVAHQP